MDSTSALDAAPVDAAPGDTAVADAGPGDAEADLAVEITPCPVFLPANALGKVADKQLGELSGMVESRRDPNVVWTHNDSGGGPMLYAINLAGKRLATWTLTGATNVDWEDLAALAKGATGQPEIYVGDIGDNDSVRTSIAVYRLVEPTVDPGQIDVKGATADWQQFNFVYPDGAHDAEALLADPPTGDLYVVSKATDGKSKVYRAAAPLVPGSQPVPLTKVAKLQFGQGTLPGDAQVTAGDIRSDGQLVALRTRNAAFAWRRPVGEALPLALLSTPCPLPIHAEDQGESFAWAVDGSGYYTLSEGVGAQLFYAHKP